jgi:hypothetical protein
VFYTSKRYYQLLNNKAKPDGENVMIPKQLLTMNAAGG